MNADTTTAAAAAHRAATEEHARASRNFGATDAELLSSIAARDALRVQAEDGAGPQGPRTCARRNTDRQAEAAALLAKAIHSGARRRMEMAEISVLASGRGSMLQDGTLRSAARSTPRGVWMTRWPLRSPPWPNSMRRGARSPMPTARLARTTRTSRTAPF